MPRPPSPRTLTLRRTLCALVVTAAAALGGCEDLDAEAEKPSPLDVTSVFGQAGLSPGQYATPRAITNDGQALYVVDKLARVQRIDPATGRCTWWFTMPEYQLGKPTGLRVLPGPEGKPALWVPDTHYHRVMVYALPEAGEITSDPGALIPEAHPRLLASFGEYGTGPGQFIYPTDIAVETGPDGKTIKRVYVTEYGSHDRVSVFDGSWKFLSDFGTWGADASPTNIQFQRPQGIIFIPGPKPELVVTDSVNHRVGRFTTDGKLITWIGGSKADPPEPDRHPGAFSHPRGITDLGDGTVLIAEFGNSRVQRIELATGKCLGLWGQVGRKPGQLVQPWSVTVLNGTAYVLDTGNNRIQAFAAPKPAR